MCAAFVASGGSCIEIWKLGRRRERSHGRPLFGACVGVAMACGCLWCCVNGREVLVRTQTGLCTCGSRHPLPSLVTAASLGLLWVVASSMGGGVEGRA